MTRVKLFCLSFAASMMLLCAATPGHAKSTNFHSPCFDIDLTNNLKLIRKTEDKHKPFYHYIFASSKSKSSKLQLYVFITNRKPEAGQSFEAFQIDSIGAISGLFMDVYKLRQYINTPENQKSLSKKPDILQIGHVPSAQLTMYFGNIDASFLVTRSDDMTYVFALVSQDNNEQIRKNKLKMLSKQLQSIKFQSCSAN